MKKIVRKNLTKMLKKILTKMLTKIWKMFFRRKIFNYPLEIKIMMGKQYTYLKNK
jgi:hypothetical protein